MNAEAETRPTEVQADQPAPRYRWVIEALVIVMLIVQTMSWLAPAPILAPMIKSLRISLGSAGLIISIIALCIGIFSFLGAIVAERVGTLRTLIIGMWLLALAEIASGFSPNFAILLACRVVEGIGYGMIIGPPAALVMQWFSAGEWPYINMVNALCAFVGIAAVFAITPHVFNILGASWERTLIVYGISAAGVALLWTILGREREGVSVAAHGAGSGSSLSEVLRMRGVVLMSIALFGGMWVFQLYTAFLPEFFRVARGMKLEEASSLTSVLPITGIVAAGLGGFLTGTLGLRRPFLWPMAVLTLVGCAGAVLMPDFNGILASLVLVGIGTSGGLAATGTLMMELPGMTSAKMNTAFATVWAVGYTGAFISPVLGGMIAPAIGLRNVMLVFLAFQIVQIVALYMLPETGPGRKRATATAAPEPARVAGDALPR